MSKLTRAVARNTYKLKRYKLNLDFGIKISNETIKAPRFEL